MTMTTIEITGEEGVELGLWLLYRNVPVVIRQGGVQMIQKSEEIIEVTVYAHETEDAGLHRQFRVHNEDEEIQAIEIILSLYSEMDIATIQRVEEYVRQRVMATARENGRV